MSKKKELPKRLYVFKETGRDGETWFTAYKDIGDCGEMGKTRLVGYYELQGTVKLETKVVTTVV